MKNIKLKSTPAMKRFNSAVEYADFITFYGWDEANTHDLVRMLHKHDSPTHREAAIEIERSESALFFSLRTISL